MSTPKYTLPPPIYLPSSGGYTSSRLTQEPFHRRVFAFRRWSVDEDGRLVCRTRHAGRDSRPKPYERPSKPPGFTTPNDRGSSRIPHDHTPRTNIDGSTLGRLFQNLAPLVKESSSDFDSKAAAICASLGLDPTTSEEIIGSFKRQFRANGSQESSHPPASGPAVEPIVQPTLTTHAPTRPASGPSLVPSKRQRPFSSGPRGNTVWYSTESNGPILFPAFDLPTSAGILYIHRDLTNDATQVWMCDIRGNWIDITNTKGVKHPSLADRILLLRSDGQPSWLTAVSYASIQARKERR